MPRKKFVAGNWKMFMSAASGTALVDAIVQGVNDDSVKVMVCPPFPYLSLIAQRLRGSRVGLGAQNCYAALEGAFTGEVSPLMLMDVGCSHVIIGHSERRHGFGESNELVNKKVHTALNATLDNLPGLNVILCIGETLAERENNQTHDVLAEQIEKSLLGIQPEFVKRLTIAYEPVWAIGTGKTATPEQAQSAHAFVRERLAKQFGTEAAANLIIQYGGSVKPENVPALMQQPDVDGALVGGASLKADLFLSIVRSAAGK
jgi:triosephosphate isomerase (TIM)